MEASARLALDRMSKGRRPRKRTGCRSDHRERLSGCACKVPWGRLEQGQTHASANLPACPPPYLTLRPCDCRHHHQQPSMSRLLPFLFPSCVLAYSGESGRGMPGCGRCRGGPPPGTLFENMPRDKMASSITMMERVGILGGSVAPAAWVLGAMLAGRHWSALWQTGGFEFHWKSLRG